MRLWRDEKTAGIPMDAVTRVRDMRARVHDFDWDATPLGSRRTWSPSLAWCVDLILSSGFPMSVRWGPDLIVIYNDAYAGLLGDRHPRALGKPLREVWPEIYSELGPLNEAILRGERDSFFAKDHLWLIHRYGVPEEAHFTISYSPISDTSGNKLGGMDVKFILEDDQAKPDTGVTKAKKLVLNDQVQMFVGGVLASTGYALAPVSTEMKTVYIASIPAADDLTQRQADKFPYLIRTGWSSSQPHHPLGQ